MSALWRAEVPRLQPLTAAGLDAVLGVEQQAYAFPWTRGNFIDSLAAGYHAQTLCLPGGEVVGYQVAMQAYDEVHLLNLTVAPAHQRQGHAVSLLDALMLHSRACGAHSVWLEVRHGNARARAVYGRYGFRERGMRRGYYPAPGNQREDAVVMAIDLRGDDELV